MLHGEDNSDFDWKTEMNPNRDYSKGWWYVRDGKLQFTNGHEGKFIYYELSQSVQKNFQKWLNEFVEKI